MQKNLKRSLILFIVSQLFICFIGCGRIFKNSQEGSNKEGENQKKDPPEILISMEKDIESIIEQIQKVKDQKADMARQIQIEKIGGEKKEQDQKGEEQKNQSQTGQEDKQQGKSGQSEQQGGEQKQGNQQGQGGDQQQGKEQKGQEPKVDWPSIEKTIEDLHTNWNSYEIQAQKDGASQDLRDNYELQLDTLTNWVMSHNEDETLKAANEIYQYYPKFLNLYKHQAPPDIKEIIYYVRQIIIDAQDNKWDASSKRLEAINKAWQTAIARMEKPNQELNQKVQAAIEDFSRVTRQQNYLLVKLKGNVLLKNLQEIK